MFARWKIHKVATHLVFLACATGLLLGGCKDPSQDVPAATVGDTTSPQPTTSKKDPPPTKAAASQTYTLSPDNLKVGFVGSKVTGSHEGGFEQVKGSVTLDPATLTVSSAEITIDMASVYTDTEKLTGHLKSPDFFDVEKFPTATFRVTSVKAEKTASATHQVSGELTLHGQTKPIVFPANIALDATALTGKAEFSINRKDFGILYAGMKDDLIRDGVVIKLDVNIPRKKS